MTLRSLYFEPLHFEDVMNIVDVEKPAGVIVQFGGQTPLNLAMRLHEAGVPIIGTSPDSIDLAEDRNVSARCSTIWGIPHLRTALLHQSAKPERSPSASGTRCWCAPATCSVAGPWPSFMTRRRSTITCVRPSTSLTNRPVLIDKFLEQAAEFDVDALADHTDWRHRGYSGAH